jgi:hypothetical protein
MKHYYRITPVLWEYVSGNSAATVYAIDRMPKGPLAKHIICTSRSRNDPAYWWSGSTFLRLTKPPGFDDCCSGPENTLNAVIWQNLYTWISHFQNLGYTVSDLNKLDPLKEITLFYEE